MIKYVFIDYDGTLVDSVPLLYQNYLRFLQKYGYRGTHEEFLSLMGPTIREFIGYLADKYQLTKSHEDLFEEYIEGLEEGYLNVPLMEGALEFLKWLKTSPIKAVLVTSSPSNLIKRSLGRLDIESYFEHIITGELVKKTKPDPEIYLYALKRCEVSKDAVITIEDSFNGVLSSVNAGLKTIALQQKRDLNLPPDVIHMNSWQDTLTYFRQIIIQ
jgi:HAD superfamily hydrolase (TIGR01509 family)